ncbi:MAG: hypothetical protein ABR552_02360 [Actinomycetota bacterium]|nr:hypothetical protein [Actinomycetota bacterium]
MKDRIWGLLARRAAVAALSAVALAGVAGGTLVATHRPADKPTVAASETESPEASESPEPEGTESPGGSVERFHGDATTPCPVPDGATLDGNWTHGDYVGAWAATSDHDKTRDAAKTPCGLPQHAADAHAAKGTHGKSGDHNSHGQDVSAEHRQDDNGS